MKKMDKQETSTEDIKRIVREGLMTLSDTVEREMTGIREREWLRQLGGAWGWS